MAEAMTVRPLILTFARYRLGTAPGRSNSTEHEAVSFADRAVLVHDRWIEQEIPLISSAVGDPVEAAAVVGLMAVLGIRGVLCGATGAVHALRGQQAITMITGGKIDRGVVDSCRAAPNHVRFGHRIHHPEQDF
ncbi:hypothetical protein ACQP1G_17495 [Nocardia sp. CA-107356]|uniref:hypothetical protein n=1 Tax=Nocardia sp. CA-107356 TaxID=3239972 RepID=UPI003D8D2990